MRLMLLLALTGAAMGLAGCVPSGSPASEATVQAPAAGSGGGSPEGVAVVLEEWVVRPHTPTATRGAATFAPTNRGNMPHQLVVLRTDIEPAELPRDGLVVDVRRVQVVGEVEPIPAGRSGRLDAELERGDYVLICNLPGHYAAGMYAGLIVN